MPTASTGPQVRVLNAGTELVAVDRLREHPDNPRRGVVEAVAESIQSNGFYGSVIVQRSTGYVLVGNHRLKAARELEMDAVPVTWVDVDDERAMRILIADNRTSDVGEYDEDALAQMLEHLASTDAGLAGTGYDAGALDELLADLGRAPDLDADGRSYAGINREVDPDALLGDDACTCPRCGFEFEPDPVVASPVTPGPAMSGRTDPSA